jgi:DNA-binding response OmpR family regulator
MGKILVIDDDERVRRMFRILLQGAGHEVSEAADGETGIQILQETYHDVVITDVLMPVLNGWDTISWLRRDFPETGIIAVSGGGQIGTYSCLMLAQRSGAHQVLMKPVDIRVLLSCVRSLLATRARNATGPVGGPCQ